MTIEGAWWMLVFFLAVLPVDGACVACCSDEEGIALTVIATLLFLLVGALLWALRVTLTVSA